MCVESKEDWLNRRGVDEEGVAVARSSEAGEGDHHDRDGDDDPVGAGSHDLISLVCLSLAVSVCIGVRRKGE